MPHVILLAASVSTLRAELDLLQLVDGKLPIPTGITHVVIEIGCSGFDRAWDSGINANSSIGIAPDIPISQQEHVLLLSFEPLLDKYARYLSIMPSASSGPMSKPARLGWSVPGRAIVLPYAVGEPEGFTEFHVHDNDGCSSLLAVENTGQAVGPAGCFKERERRRVPVISMRTILEWLPTSVRIAHAKIDAQGYDLRVAKSAGDGLSRIESLTMEVTADTLHLPYSGADKCMDVVNYLQSVGFEATHAHRNPLSTRERAEHACKHGWKTHYGNKKLDHSAWNFFRVG